MILEQVNVLSQLFPINGKSILTLLVVRCVIVLRWIKQLHSLDDRLLKVRYNDYIGVRGFGF